GRLGQIRDELGGVRRASPLELERGELDDLHQVEQVVGLACDEPSSGGGVSRAGEIPLETALALDEREAFVSLRHLRSTRPARTVTHGWPDRAPDSCIDRTTTLDWAAVRHRSQGLRPRCCRTGPARGGR